MDVRLRTLWSFVLQVRIKQAFQDRQAVRFHSLYSHKRYTNPLHGHRHRPCMYVWILCVWRVWGGKGVERETEEEEEGEEEEEEEGENGGWEGGGSWEEGGEGGGWRSGGGVGWSGRRGQITERGRRREESGSGAQEGEREEGKGGRETTNSASGECTTFVLPLPGRWSVSSQSLKLK